MEQIIKNKILDLIKQSIYKSDTLYLLYAINESSAFFFQNEKIIFGQNTKINQEMPQIYTEFLTLVTSVYISAITNNTTYNSGKYNLLIFNRDLDDENFSNFINLCMMYADIEGLVFEDFFYSMIDIFQLPSTTKELNLIGFFGELSLIVKLWQDYHFDMSNMWHTEGSNSRYDFSCLEYNIEVKTSTRESSTFKIKHSQLFNMSNNYIVIINIKENGRFSLNDLIEYCMKTPPFSHNMNFQIKLLQEKMKVDLNKLKSQKFSVDRFVFFSKENLETISSIPECINEISYNYTFNLSDGICIEEMSEILRK